MNVIEDSKFARPKAGIITLVNLYPAGAAFAQARDLTIEEARALSPYLRTQWEREMGAELGSPVSAWCGKAPTSEERT
jgi:hypothetical protein